MAFNPSNIYANLGYGGQQVTGVQDPLNQQGLLYQPPKPPTQQPGQQVSTGGQQPPLPPGPPAAGGAGGPGFQVPGGQNQPPNLPGNPGSQNNPPTVGGAQDQPKDSGQQPAPYQQFQPTQLADQLSNFLNNRFFNYQGPPGFQAPQFSPGSNPFTPQFSQNPIMGQGGQAQQFSQDWLKTPSRFDTPLVQKSIDLANQTLAQQQQAALTKNNENAASRGLYYSSVPQGTEGDIRIRTEQARQEFLNKLLSEQAQTVGQDRAQALAGALGYSGQQFGQELGQFQAGLQGRGQQFQEAATGYGLGLQGQEQGFRQQQQTLSDLLGYQQQSFQDQLATAGFNQQQDQLQNQLMLALLGST